MEDDGSNLGATMATHVRENMAPALVFVHPKGAAVVVAIGACLRIFDFIKNAPVTTEDDTTPGRHGEAIRAIAFNTEGNLFASAGDDKLVKLWNSETWCCVKTIRLAKKVTAVTFSKDSQWLLLADKFGVVYVLPTASKDQQKGNPVQLLAHCCSIVTDMELSPDGKYVITSDRDFKIRVSVFPADPLKGAHEIWSYCLGHTSFVTCVGFVGARSNAKQFLISGSGDATVRLWDYESGKQLDTFDTGDVDELSNGNNCEEPSRGVVGLSVSPDGFVAAVLIERFSGVLLLEYDPQLKKLKYLQSIFLSEQVSPTSLAFDVDCRLWLVAGAAESVELGDQLITPEEAAAAESRAHTIGKTAVAYVRLIRKATSPFPATSEACPKGEEHSVGISAAAAYGLCGEGDVPGGEALLPTLQGSKVNAAEVALAAEAAEQAMRKLMSKRQYTIEQRENRKRSRNDKKLENKGA